MSALHANPTVIYRIVYYSVGRTAHIDEIQAISCEMIYILYHIYKATTYCTYDVQYRITGFKLEVVRWSLFCIIFAKLWYTVHITICTEYWTCFSVFLSWSFYCIIFLSSITIFIFVVDVLFIMHHTHLFIIFVQCMQIGAFKS